MKHILAIITLVFFLCVFSGCNSEGKTGKKASFPEGSFSKEGSYALGMNIGSSLKADNLYPDMEEFARGMNDVLHDSKPRYSIEEAYQVFREAYSLLAEEREMANKQAEIEFLAENSKKPGIKITGSGLQYEVMREGNGPKPSAADAVRVHYEGALTDGTVFDSSYSSGEPIEFPLARVIPGWAEGLQLMSEGSKYRFVIPSELGYGLQGAGGQIPPYSTLVFEVELLNIIH
ncbi:MAG: FKBP-type peptidyl-prolyl cis-trans isomerase [Treponema sp.]|jgi:FKBP-type peptidyl-prolyl cis-trans isomerase|nr:FKBP-type peptidyl-prolyl cis-trans isomerase [Treponema sp.]